MKKKGFTLVELLVTIVILGIITGLSIPLLRALSNNRSDKQYKTYMSSLIASAKLYNDTYSEDLFGKNENGCARVKYQVLKESKLLKDISINNVSCNSDYTKVRIIKFQGKYYYGGVLGCGGKKEGENNALEDKDITYKYPNSDLTCVDIDGDGIEDEGGEGQTFNPFSLSIKGKVGSSFNSKRKSTTVHISSPFGITPNISLYYAWSESNDYNSIGSNEWKKVNIQVSAENTQKEKIKFGEDVTVDSSEIITPKDADGAYYLFVRVDSLIDLSGNPWSGMNGNNYISSGVYSVDSKPPVFNSSSKVITESGSYNTLKPKLNLDVTDNHTNTESLKMCVSLNTNQCGTDSNDIKNYETYNPNKVLDNIHNTFDGSSHKIYVTVADKAGNTTTQSFDYTVAKSYTLTYDNNGGSGCNKKTVNKNVDNTTDKWGELCVPTRNNYTHDSWNTKADGTGTKYTADSLISADTKIYSIWKANYTRIKIHVNGGSLGSQHGADYAESNGYITYKGSEFIHNIKATGSIGEYGLADHNNTSAINIVKNGYTINANNAWNTKADGTGTSYNETSNYTAKDFCDSTAADCEVTLYANWKLAKPNTPTVTNSSGGNWTKSDVKLDYKTTSPASIIGKWYWRYGSDAYQEWSGMAGKTSFSYTYKSDINKSMDVIVCNKNASGPNDTANCSGKVNTNIKIDKTPPYLGSFSSSNSGGYHLLEYVIYDAGTGVSRRRIRTNQGLDTSDNWGCIWAASEALGTWNSYVEYYYDYVCDCLDNCTSIGWNHYDY